MDIQYTPQAITLISEKKEIILQNDAIILDGFLVDVPGEYEKGGFLLYVREYEGIRLAHFRVEGYWCGYMSDIPESMSGDMLDFFGQLDILFAPIEKKHQSLLEQIEPRLLVSYGGGACEMPQVLGVSCEVVSQYRLKSGDISSEKTGLVILG